MSRKVTYRLFEEADLPGLLRLWKEEAGWGELSPEDWRKWYVQTPHGQAPVVVTADGQSGEILGQFAFTPAVVSVNGRPVRALRPSAPIATKALTLAMRDLRPAEHPVAAMYTHAVEALQGQGHALLYMLPDPRWERALQMAPFLRCGKFPLWSVALPLPAPLPLGTGFTAHPLRQNDRRIDGLWERAARLHGCLVRRDSRTLPWKIGGAEYAVLGVGQGRELVGMVAGRPKGEGQWLICDLLAADAGAALRATLAAAVNLSHFRAREAPPGGALRKAAVLATPLLERAARELGFARDAYDFPLAVHLLDRSIREEDVAPERWYVSAND
jgi:hypothetical protein